MSKMWLTAGWVWWNVIDFHHLCWTNGLKSSQLSFLDRIKFKKQHKTHLIEGFLREIRFVVPSWAIKEQSPYYAHSLTILLMNNSQSSLSKTSISNNWVESADCLASVASEILPFSSCDYAGIGPFSSFLLRDESKNKYLGLIHCGGHENNSICDSCFLGCVPSEEVTTAVYTHNPKISRCVGSAQRTHTVGVAFSRTGHQSVDICV